MWRKTKRVRQSNPTDWPSGLFVNTPEATYYIKGTTRFKVYSDRVLASWSVTPALGTLESLKSFKLGGTLGFRDGTLIHNIANGRMYLVSANKRRHITSPDVFTRYGLDESKMFRVSEAEANLHEEGATLS